MKENTRFLRALRGAEARDSKREIRANVDARTAALLERNAEA
jgi:hypothetical protein